MQACLSLDSTLMAAELGIVVTRFGGFNGRAFNTNPVYGEGLHGHCSARLRCRDDSGSITKTTTSRLPMASHPVR
jgi:hypothetical protein